jgi:hypothetical protein
MWPNFAWLAAVCVRWTVLHELQHANQPCRRIPKVRVFLLWSIAQSACPAKSSPSTPVCLGPTPFYLATSEHDGVYPDMGSQPRGASAVVGVRTAPGVPWRSSSATLAAASGLRAAVHARDGYGHASRDGREKPSARARGHQSSPLGHPVVIISRHAESPGMPKGDVCEDMT